MYKKLAPREGEAPAEPRIICRVRLGRSRAPKGYPAITPRPRFSASFSPWHGIADNKSVFRLSLIILIGLFALPGCGELSDVWGNPQDRAKKGLYDSDTAPFEIGPASKWAKTGLYLDYAKSHGVALKSDHGMLVAILLVGPESGAEVRYDRLPNLFRDSQSGETFTTDGVKWGGADDRPSLARCRIRHLGPLEDPHVGLVVDPGKLFRQEDRQWSKAASNHLFVKAED